MNIPGREYVNRAKFFEGLVLLGLSIPSKLLSLKSYKNSDDIISFDPVGFSIIVGEKIPLVTKIIYYASDGKHFVRGFFTTSDYTGNQSIVGLGFKPSYVFIIEMTGEINV